MTPREVSDYLERIGLDGAAPLVPDGATLRTLHRAHLHTVPFENLDIHRGVALRLDVVSLLAKIVGRRRGGLCYELNGLFAALLEALGFEVRLLSARVARGDGEPGPERDHVLLHVRIGTERWLADVGFGDSFLDPLRLDLPGVQRQGPRAFRLEPGWAVHRLEATGATRDLVFTLEPHVLEDFAARCRFHETSPESPFARGPVATLARADGRVTLTGRRLVRTDLEGRARETIDLADDVAVTLAHRELFGLEVG